MTKAAVLAVEEVSKTFPGVRALQAVNFDVETGEIHALVGQNGAGKSTLMNILAGVLQPDNGRILMGGAPVVMRDPAHARTLGISTVHQELSLFPSRSVAENIFVGRLPKRRNGFVDRQRLLAQSQAALAPLEAAIDPLRLVRDLAFSSQQLVEIARALSVGGKVLILDEPTSALNEHETGLLFRQLRRLRAAGMAIIYVSHRLREVFALCDRVTVLRDGRVSGTFPIRETTPDAVISMMVNRRVAEIVQQGAGVRGPTIMAVRGLVVPPTVHGVDVDLHAGEILGLAGLAGAGQTEIGRAIAGSLSCRAESLILDGAPSRAHTPHQAMRNGIVYFPADRRAEGLFLRLDVEEKIVSASLDALRVGPWMNDAEARRVAGGFVDTLAIRTPSLYTRVGNLSGGNQQKVVLARGLSVDARVFVADEPTRGIDVGAKAEIYLLLRRLAESGKGILLISTELPELLAISDRILVLNSGRVVGELGAAEASEERIMSLASGQIEMAS
jgi:ribose transport system ATP-binding protein